MTSTVLVVFCWFERAEQWPVKLNDLCHFSKWHYIVGQTSESSPRIAASLCNLCTNIPQLSLSVKEILPITQWLTAGAA